MKKVYIATNKEMVSGVFAATVEAEFGDYCVEGTKATLAHHGSRANNPAPCCVEVDTLEEGENILVSHIDLDTIGGCAALLGIKPECNSFWEAAAFVDVHGPHNMYKLSQEQQDMLNAYYAWAPRLPRYTEVTDVTDVVVEHIRFIERIIVGEKDVIEAGREWRASTTAAVEERLYRETSMVRAFVTDGLFCGASYYSPTKEAVIPATVTLNTRYGSVTVAFEDGGKDHSAVEIVQKLWGAEAGGRSAIAGSPRGWHKSPEELQEEFERTIKAVEDLYR